MAHSPVCFCRGTGPPVPPKWQAAATVSAVVWCRCDGNGCRRLGLPGGEGDSLVTAPQQRNRVAGESSHRPQRNVADDARHAEGFILDERGGKRSIAFEVETDEAGEIVERAADLPALDHLLEAGKPPLEAVL